MMENINMYIKYFLKILNVNGNFIFILVGYNIAVPKNFQIIDTLL